MGDRDGFMRVRRKDADHRPVSERVRDFKPHELPLSPDDLRDQVRRCMDCGIPFCHGCGCPLSIVIPELNDLVLHERWREALELLLSTNNFPEFTGRICPALCEASCVLGINDDPVTIRQVELAIVEKGFELGYLAPRPPKTRVARSVAVVGSGPSGLAVADSLNQAGCRVTVYDRAPHAGGILRYGIPDFKLDKHVIDRRVQLMEEEGVVFELGLSVGDDLSYNFLQSRFDAVCLTGGAREARDLPVPGRELSGIHPAMDYLTRQNMLLSGEPVPENERITAEGKGVVVIGGGDTGSDCLGTALRQGARHVYQFEIMPRPGEARGEYNPWPEWPQVMAQSSSHKEGGERRWGVKTVGFEGEGGEVKRLLAVEVEWEMEREQPVRMKEIPESGFGVDVELVLLALGFVGPERSPLFDALGLERDERGNLLTNENHMTSREGVFAAGDMAQGQSLVVRAIADGRDAAVGILEHLGVTPGIVG